MASSGYTLEVSKENQKLGQGLEVKQTDRKVAFLNQDWSTVLGKRTCPTDLHSASFLCLKSVGCYFSPALKTPQS